uniref:NADH dehydrogenase subunit 6 n=1 Tax=Elephantulus rupestris TaxID=113278 RepID=UPI002435A9E6|nr:NADH dehydrogenase subunit 6 [Elephantulus rupestris]WEW63431.1 NADH dehydrogenase subunit 6 [Elephantulus rupestris]
MMYAVFMLSVVFVLGLVGVSSKPSPIFGGLGLILSGGVGCGLIISSGGSFLGLMVFLVYLGGMMVVFGYTTAMATEEYPEGWGSSKVVFGGVLVGVFIEVMIGGWLYSEAGGMMGDMLLWGFNGDVMDGGLGGGAVRGDYAGSSFLYGQGGWLLMICAWILFVSIFIIIEVVRGI